SASTYAALGQSEQARSRFERSLAIREQVLAENDPDIARSLDGLAALLVRDAQFPQAEAMLERSVAIHEASGSEPVELGQSLGQLGLAYAGQQRFPEAEETLRRSLELMKQQLEVEHPAVVATRANYERVRNQHPANSQPVTNEVEDAPAAMQAAPSEVEDAPPAMQAPVAQ
ncbi:MAG: tetratricopeptide repeat protein, partial [Myxococcales bacterium]|nr:tetratricopeptide repeat protein [Myxococcales bacterium]